MGKQQDREKIVQEIKIAADLYRKHLVGKRFLYGKRKILLHYS